MVEKGSKLPGLSLLKIPARIIGPIKAVPVKLVRANKTKCSELKMEKTRAIRAKTAIKIRVIKSAFRSSKGKRDLNSAPKAKICESEVEIAAAISPINPKAATVAC